METVSCGMETVSCGMDPVSCEKFPSRTGWKPSLAGWILSLAGQRLFRADFGYPARDSFYPVRATGRFSGGSAGKGGVFGKKGRGRDPFRRDGDSPVRGRRLFARDRDPSVHQPDGFVKICRRTWRSRQEAAPCRKLRLVCGRRPCAGRRGRS